MEEIWSLAERQHALFARWQSSAFGVGWRQLDTHLRAGTLELFTDRVLRLTGAPRTSQQELMGHILDAGPGSFATKRSSAWLWEVPGCTAGPLDVVRARGQGAREGASCRWPRHVAPAHLTTVQGIPTFSLARTIIELAGMPEYAPRIGRMIDTIDGRSPTLLVALHKILPEVATRGKPGIQLMRELLADRPPDRVRLTGIERRFEWCLTSRGLAVPRRQVDLGGHSWFGRVDYYDDHTRVIFEIDSALHHASRLDRLRDAERDAEAARAGFNEVVRITDEEVWYDPPLVRKKVRDARRTWRSAFPA